jgi:hypothetical protein
MWNRRRVTGVHTPPAYGLKIFRACETYPPEVSWRLELCDVECGPEFATEVSVTNAPSRIALNAFAVDSMTEISGSPMI